MSTIKKAMTMQPIRNIRLMEQSTTMNTSTHPTNTAVHTRIGNITAAQDIARVESMDRTTAVNVPYTEETAKSMVTFCHVAHLCKSLAMAFLRTRKGSQDISILCFSRA
jgi:hypothetical protein